MSNKKKKHQNQNEPNDQTRTGRKGPLIWIVFLAVSLALNAALFYNFFTDNFSETEKDIMLSDCMVRLDDALAREQDCSDNLAGIEKRLTDVMMKNDAPMKKLRDEDINKLKTAGLDNPIYRITNDLMGHPELIPLQSGTSRKMSFPSADGITILSQDLVFARFTDGVINGHMILEYSVGKNGRIQWKALEAFQD